MYGETIFLNQIQDLKMGKGTKVIRDKAYETIGKDHFGSSIADFQVLARNMVLFSG